MRRLFQIAIPLLALAACKSGADQTDFKTITVKYPVTQKDTTVKDVYFGTTVADPYRWLENDTAENTKAWVKAENDVTTELFFTNPFS
jgi:prolyl oligopeptidase